MCTNSSSPVQMSLRRLRLYLFDLMACIPRADGAASQRFTADLQVVTVVIEEGGWLPELWPTGRWTVILPWEQVQAICQLRAPLQFLLQQSTTVAAPAQASICHTALSNVCCWGICMQFVIAVAGVVTCLMFSARAVEFRVQDLRAWLSGLGHGDNGRRQVVAHRAFPKLGLPCLLQWRLADP